MIRALDARGAARQLRGPRRGVGARGARRRASSSGCSRCRSRRRSTASSTAMRRPTTTCRSPRRSRRDEAVLRDVRRHTRHGRDRAHASSVRPAVDGLRVINAGSVGMAYEGEVAAFWTILDDGEPSFRRTPFDVERAVAETRASAWPHAQEFVDENLLWRSTATRRSRRSRAAAREGPDREGRPSARDRRRVLRRAAVATTPAGGRPARRSSPAARRWRSWRTARRRRPAGDQARPAGRARRDPRGRARGSAARPARTSTTPSSSSGSRSWRRPAVRSEASQAVTPGVANDVLELDSGVLLPMVEDCIRDDRPRGAGGSWSRRGFSARLTPLQLDVFTLVPHAFAWLTEQRPGRDRARRRARPAPLLLPRLHAAARTARSTTSRTAAAPAWCCASTSSPRRSTRSTAALPAHRVVALTPQGRQLTQAVVEELAAEEHVTLLSARFEGFDERIVEHLAPTRSRSAPTSSRTATCRRWCSSTRSRAGCRARCARARASSSRSPRSSAAGSSTRTTRVRRSSAGWRVPDVLLSGDHAKIERWRREHVR